MHADEQLVRGRVYGHDHDDPDPGPRPAKSYAAPIVGPLDGLLLAARVLVGMAFKGQRRE